MKSNNSLPMSSLRAMSAPELLVFAQITPEPAAPPEERREVFAGLTQEELERAFALVKPDNRKDPIEILVYLSDAELRHLIAAVPFFTGGAVFLVPVAGGMREAIRKEGDPDRLLYRASAAGYYACVGA
jgi:hypothetical protein